MKIRDGFVSNSSSSSFLITNTSNKPLTLIDFIIENRELLESSIEYGYGDEPHQFVPLLYSAKENNIDFPVGQDVKCRFGVHPIYTQVGAILYFVLGDEDNPNGQSKNFKWKFLEFYL